MNTAGHSRLNRYLARIATLGPVGFMPKAPGTFGTLAAVPLVWLLIPMGPVVFLACTILAIIIGTLACGVAERILQKKDPQEVVIDEVAGYMVAMLFLPATASYMLAAFIIFRILDIMKPTPINKLQNIKGAVGVMADDLAAGLITNAGLQLWRILI